MIDSDYLGTDIAESDGELGLIYGDFKTVSGQEAFQQRVIRRLTTPKGSLFYDSDYGTRLHEFVQVNVDKLVLMDFEAEIRAGLEADPLVDIDSISITTAYSIETGLKSKVSFSELGYDTTLNLVVATDKELSIWSA